MVAAAVDIIMSPYTGRSRSPAGEERKVIPYVGVKEAVLPFNMFPEADPVLGPEMRSTGEVLGLAESFGGAYLKAQEAAGSPLPERGAVFLRSGADDFSDLRIAAAGFRSAGFTLLSESDTAEALRRCMIPVEALSPGEAVAAIDSGLAALVVDSSFASDEDSLIRRSAVSAGAPYITTAAAAEAAAFALCTSGGDEKPVYSLQELHERIK